MGAQVSIAAEVAQVKDAQLRVGARAEELTAKTDNLTLGVKDVLDRVAEVGADTMTIRGVAEQIKGVAANVAALQAHAGCADVIFEYHSPGSSKSKKKGGMKSLTNSPYVGWWVLGGGC